MEFWFLTVATAIFLIAAARLFAGRRKTPSLPPGPASFPFIGNLIWLRKPLSEMEFILRRLAPNYGPLIAMRVGNRPFVFIGSRSLAHQALIQNGAVFSDRPDPVTVSRYLNRGDPLAINSSKYGPTWRFLRRNLTHEIMNPSRVKAYSGCRRSVLSILIRRLAAASESSPVKAMDHFHDAMFSLLVFMCFGDGVSEAQIKAIESVQRRLLVSFRLFSRLSFLPPLLGRILFRNTWNDMVRLREDQESVLIPPIRARLLQRNQNAKPGDDEHGGDRKNHVTAYVDTLVDLEHPEKGRKLTETEMMTLCSEFLNAGTDTTSTTLQWLMANLVKHPDCRNRLYDEITRVVGGEAPAVAENGLDKVVEEEDLEKMPYLKAVVLETLRRHPPGHFLLPHKATEDTELNGYRIPKNAIINFMLADMGWDPEVWDDPMEFKPERFVETTFDITGKKEIKMMPFGVGRRMCPGLGLALLHLEFFVANLVWYLEWSPVDGEGVDLSEKQEFTTVMKYPLRANVSLRSVSSSSG